MNVSLQTSIRSPLISEARSGDIIVVTLDNPPVNALSSRTGLVQALIAALTRAENDAAVRAVVIAAAGRFFSAGADIGDFSENPAADVAPIRALIALVDAMTKPTVAAMNGIAFGGGLELALACSMRVALKGTRFAFPEVTLGLLPGGGGTQRLPRLVGVSHALDMMLSGRQIGAQHALEIGLIDQVADRDLETAACSAARLLAVEGKTRRTSSIKLDGVPDARIQIDDARSKIVAKDPLATAKFAIADCVAGALGEAATGQALEHHLFDELMLSEVSRGLRHAFLIERRLDKVPGLVPLEPAREIRHVIIVGGGTMGVGIATAVLNAGFRATIVERVAEVGERASAAVSRNIRALEKKGRIAPEAAGQRIRKLSVVTALSAAVAGELYIEAVFEDMDLKKTIFAELESQTSADAILATNTSTLDVETIARDLQRPERVVGMHFFSPAHIMKLLEIIRTGYTSPETLSETLAFARKLGKVGVVSGVCDGFIGNRIFEEYLRQAYFLLEEGALPKQIDCALEAWGFAMGPLKVMDLAGQDIGWSIRRRRAAEQPDRPYSVLPDRICELGRFGQKTGAGYYLYPEGSRAPVEDPFVNQLVLDHSASMGIERRSVTDQEIVDRCLCAMINEGARILEEGVAARPLDVDAVYLHGYGFPHARGGPMFHADRIGLPRVLERLRGFAKGYQGWAYDPSPLLEKLAHDGGSFQSLNG